MKFLAPLSLLLAAASASKNAASAFVAPSRTTLVIHRTALKKESVTFLPSSSSSALHMSAVSGDEEKEANEEGLPFSAKLPDLNLESLDIVKVKDNILDGDFGTRGEAFAAAQFALLFCILGGGIPVIGDFLMVLLGPGLLVAGLGTLVVGVKDLGDINLSPWLAPPSGGKLVTDGIYGQLRHPVYAGILAALAGFSIVTGSANRLLLTGILFYAFNVIADKEEEELVDQYSGYDSYRSKVTGRFFPNALLEQLPWNNME